MKKTKVIGIFGYNNTRLYDVKNLQNLAKKRFNAEILLIKEGISSADREVTPFCLDHKPEDPHITSILNEYLLSINLEMIVAMPFSDKGVIGAAHFANDMNLFGDDATTSLAMVDKKEFRVLEAVLMADALEYKIPFFDIANSEDEILRIYAKRRKFFIKPTSEGNSRGCMAINSLADVKAWLSQFRHLIPHGVICEEILSKNNEYSFDGVGNKFWITRKFTAEGAYRAEYQHIVPAPLNDDVRKRIHFHLEPLMKKLGSNGGAFHHEFFLLESGQIASVVPNRRPAGMWIWDLASWAHIDFDPWMRWMDHCVNGFSPKFELKPDGFAGIRAVIAKQNGVLKKLDMASMRAELFELFGEDNVRIAALKEVSQKVNSVPRDNSDFLGYVALRNKEYDRLLVSLEKANEIFIKYCEVLPCD